MTGRKYETYGLFHFHCSRRNNGHFGEKMPRPSLRQALSLSGTGRRNGLGNGWLTEAPGIQPGLRPEPMRLSLCGYQRGEREGKELQPCREDASRTSFFLASAASICQNTCTNVDEASLTKLGRNYWREAQGDTINRTKKVPDTFNSP